nr:hypothetical protein [Limosilactobacillus reuteri]
MIRRHVVESGFIALCVILTAIVLMMWWVSQYSHFIITAMMTMIILGLAMGSLVPNIVLTWLAIGLTTVGSAILLLGYVVMDNSIKIMLLFAFPITASLAYFSRYIIGEWGWIDRNRAEIESYAIHYNQIVKLQTAYNTNRIYEKEL